jgi:hypothetical protein
MNNFGKQRYLNLVFLILAFIASSPATAVDKVEATPTPQSVAPTPLDFIILANAAYFREAGMLLNSIDGKFILKPSPSPQYSNLSLMTYAVHPRFCNQNAITDDLQRYYDRNDPELLQRMESKAIDQLSKLGFEVKSNPTDIIFFNKCNELMVARDVAFALHPRIDLDTLKPLIDQGQIIAVGEVSAAATLNEVKQDRQKALAERQEYEETQKQILSQLPGMNDYAIALVVNNKTQQRDTEAKPREICSISASGEMGSSLIGLRYLEQFNTGLQTMRKTTFDRVASNLDELYGFVQAGQCSVLVVTNTDAVTLTNVFQRDKFNFSVYKWLQKSDAIASYAESRGFESTEKMNLADSMVPGTSLTSAELERLAALGVKSVDDFNAESSRMIKSKYADKPTVGNLLAFLEDENTGKPLKQSATQVKTIRDQKELAEQRAAEQAERIRRAAFAKDYPYYAVLSCGLPNNEQFFYTININACFTDSNGVHTELTIVNAGVSRMYTVYSNIAQSGDEQRDGLHIDLKAHFSIKAQNSSDTLILTLKIFDRASNRMIFNQQAAQFGVVRASF